MNIACHTDSQQTVTTPRLSSWHFTGLPKTPPLIVSPPYPYTPFLFPSLFLCQFCLAVAVLLSPFLCSSVWLGVCLSSESEREKDIVRFQELTNLFCLSLSVIFALSLSDCLTCCLYVYLFLLVPARNTHTRTHTHTCAYTRTHTHTGAYVQTHTDTHRQTHTHTRTHTSTHTHACTCAHIYVHMHV